MRALRVARLVAVLAILGVLLPAISAPPSAAQSVEAEVTLTIERVRQLECVDDSLFGCTSQADFYAKMSIDGQQQTTGVFNNDNVITPNWVQRRTITGTRADLKIEMWDDDGFLNGADDQVDIDPGNGRRLDLRVNLNSCSVSGDVSGPCGVTIRSSGAQSDRAEVRFRVDVRIIPPAVRPMVRCTHSPAWPDTGDTVTINVDTVTGSGTSLPALRVDALQIWVNNGVGPATQVTNRSSHSFTVTATGDQLSYGCHASNGDHRVFSGWRTMRVGEQPGNEPVPVLYQGSRHDHLDLVIYADLNDAAYSSPDDPDFLADIAVMIRGGYWSEEIFLNNQDKINVWVGQTDARIVHEASPDPSCDQTVTNEAGFADVSIILHRESLRDCSPSGRFSTEPRSFRTIRHETGHTPFGLADEYCCDGGYWQANTLPNVYTSRNSCRADAPNYGHSPSDCRSIVSTRNDRTYWVADAPNNLLNGGTTVEGATKRRMDWIFSECEAGRC